MGIQANLVLVDKTDVVPCDIFHDDDYREKGNLGLLVNQEDLFLFIDSWIIQRLFESILGRERLLNKPAKITIVDFFLIKTNFDFLDRKNKSFGVWEYDMLKGLHLDEFVDSGKFIYDDSDWELLEARRVIDTLLEDHLDHIMEGRVWYSVSRLEIK